MNQIFSTIRSLFLVFLSSISLSAATAPSWMMHLATAGVDEIELHTDLNVLLTREPTDDEYQAATIVYSTQDKQEFRWEIGVKPRGKYRRRICDFPPLKLNFSKGDLREQGLAEFDKLKLVTHCTDDRMASNEAVIREFLAYQLYQELSEQSFKAHLIRIRYVDINGELSSFNRYGILLESVDELAERLDATECEDCYVSHPTSVDALAENKLAVFQYMIGNTDFSLSQRRNLKLLIPNNGGAYIPVAYDFDFAAIVSSSYAIPARYLGQQTLNDRVYLGFAVSDELMERTLSVFETKQATLLDIIRKEKRLSLTARAEMKSYLNNFFATIRVWKTATGSNRTYTQIRQSAPQAIPDGGEPEHYDVRK